MANGAHVGRVLTEESQVECGHAGKLSMTGAPNPAVKGKPLLTEDSVLAATISDCIKTNTNAGEFPCSKVVSISTVNATGLRIGGKAVDTSDPGNSGRRNAGHGREKR